MKVVARWLLASMIGVLTSPLARIGEARRVGDLNAVEVPSNSSPEDGQVEEEGGERSAAACGRLTCASRLHFCSETLFAFNSCEGFAGDILDVPAGDDRPFTCWRDYPTVIVLGGVAECVGQIGSVKFEMNQGSKRIRGFVEKQYPYTVFGDTTIPFTVNSRPLPSSPYTMNVTIKDPNGCTMERKEYSFDILACG